MALVRVAPARRRAGFWALSTLAVLAATAAAAQDRPTYSLYGSTGLIDMPTGEMPADGEFALTTNTYSGVLRTALTFQIAPRLSGTFRYSVIDNYYGPGDDQELYDRSFDVSYQISREGNFVPGVVVGLRDFGGTGVFASEFVAASKHLRPDLVVTGGIGWGRLGSYGSFDNPLGVIADGFNDRPDSFSDISDTGQVAFDSFFRGPAALFGGVEWRPSDRLSFKAEYSSDAYERETDFAGFDRRTPFNFAATYRMRNGVDLTGFALHGSEFGMMATLAFDPAKARFTSGREPAPPPVVPVALADQRAAASWGDVPGETLSARVAAALKPQGIELESLSITGSTATVRVRNGSYDAAPQAVGRTARVLTATLPAAVGTFRIVPVVRGIPASAITLRRADLEELELAPDGSWQSFARADIADAAGSRFDPAGAPMRQYPAFEWQIAPYSQQAFFDPDAPLRADFGAQLSFGLDLAPGMIVSGSVRQKVVGNLDESTRVSNSVIQHVRSDVTLYDKTEEAEITHLTGEYFFRPGPDLYGRVTAGYLERMYGGVSGEVLWKPVASRLALGAELNYAVQREFDSGFGFQDYDVVTGHASAYYDFGGGYLGQLDAGRYLAGDWGATFGLDREFGNGFTVGAFFTLTDVSFDDFGEGSFDKGIRISIPLSWLAGEPSQRGFATTIRPVTRDGGARLNVRNRLYGLTRDYHGPELQDNWGRFWR
ncbi:YjbH domain-containing protein [Frigidibacter sp.]|uniref:YjbH domain-containing protein n=1 Tax=Frigidibacter sp. TaxID=2586418 RepID=UPI0027370626|nr:YjbH domain-containing protein [Frigidibacter sp.]MDP3340201.1 YjbH domain-containing protein [Frigidibacter sp.]